MAVESTLELQQGNSYKTKNWFEECEEATRRKNQAYLKVQQGRRTRNLMEKYRELRRIEKRIRKAKKREYDNKIFKELEHLHSKHETKNSTRKSTRVEDNSNLEQTWSEMAKTNC